MTPKEFEALARDAWKKVPVDVLGKIENVGLLIEDAPSPEVLHEEGIPADGTLLGLYRGVPKTALGSEYGIGGVLPDTITLFRLPILHEAGSLFGEMPAPEGGNTPQTFREVVEKVIRETLWHEIAHHFGMDEDAVSRREGEGTNRYKDQKPA